MRPPPSLSCRQDTAEQTSQALSQLEPSRLVPSVLPSPIGRMQTRLERLSSLHNDLADATGAAPENGGGAKQGGSSERGPDKVRPRSLAAWPVRTATSEMTSS